MDDRKHHCVNSVMDSDQIGSTYMAVWLVLLPAILYLSLMISYTDLKLW